MYVDSKYFGYVNNMKHKERRKQLFLCGRVILHLSHRSFLPRMSYNAMSRVSTVAHLNLYLLVFRDILLPSPRPQH
jgi:hypothetical protein